MYFRNRSALAVNCCVIIHCLEVGCKEDQITSNNSRNRADLFRFDSNTQYTKKTHLKNSRQYLDYVIRVFVTSFNRKNDVTPSNAMNDVIFQPQMTSTGTHFPRAFKTVTYCLIYHTF